jgi:MoCo/4Fe-4S cofactor protein with predicted Tat translocation signal
MTPVETANPTTSEGSQGPQLWRSLEEYTDTPEFREMLYREFPEDASEWTDPVSRRQFLTLMGASLALAGAVGCSPRPAPNRKIIPYVTQPEQIVPGNPLYFATAYPLGGIATGVLVKSYEGRPVKIEGNRDHPGSLGGTDIFAQASILNLYDPDRSQTLTKNGVAALWEDALRAIRALLEKQKPKGGAGIRILSETVTSPTFINQLAEFQKLYPSIKWVQYDTVSRDNVRQGTQLAFGKVLNPIYDFTKADVVLSIDSDFLAYGPGSPRYARDFFKRRKVRQNKYASIGINNTVEMLGIHAEEMNRLYVVESMLTSTGSVADHRLAIRNSDMENFLRALAAEVGVVGSPKPATELVGLAKDWIKPLADDLKKAKGKSLVLVGDTQPAGVHAVAYAINQHLENVNKTISFTAPLESGSSLDQHADLKALVEDMNSGKVDLLLILDSNPVFTAPSDFKFLDALKKVPTRVHLGLYVDETAKWCHWHIPGTHYLETWGDARGFDGTVSIMQPLIAPLYEGKSALELFNELMDVGDSSTAVKAANPRDIVRRYWQDKLKGASEDFETIWQKSLQEGIVPNTALAKENNALKADWGNSVPNTAPKSGVEIVFRPDPTIHDGRFANNGWLQELPKPITKVTWDNVVYMSEKTAQKWGIKNQFPRRSGGGEHGKGETTLVELKYKGKSLKMPVWIQPGTAEDVVVVHLGYGREAAGKVGDQKGFNTYTLRTSEALWFDTGVEGTRTSESYLVACTQMHANMEGRKPVRYGTVTDYTKKDFDFATTPPGAAGETDAINKLVPGPNEDWKGHHDHPESEHKKDEHKKEEGKENGKAKHHDSRVIPLTIVPATNKEGRRWAMAIDIGSCMGCGACLVACQSENNIPVVGKDQVMKGREMNWIRIDRYYEGNPNDPNNLSVHMQPVPCQQCEKAPCEVVCPVAATVHSADGLNDMIYNRCVGTRYCSNNCPYKVRRFNFLTFADFKTESFKLMHNPEVTVRSRGVMEKCTYCVQRIRAAEIEAEREWSTGSVDASGEWSTRKLDEHGRPQILDGEIVTACQSACPSGAIIFGDLSHHHSGVNRWKAEPLNYGLLAELNTMPRTTYLASVSNPNPNMPKAKGA